MWEEQINTAEEILGQLDQEPGVRRGYPERISRQRLWGVRQHLIGLLERTWDEVGCALSSVRNMARLKEVLEPWRKFVDQEDHVIRMLLRETERKTTSKSLNRQRKELGKLHNRFLDASEYIRQCWDSLERFLVIPAESLTPPQKEVVRDAIYERARILARAGVECMASENQEKAAEEALRDGEAYFARTEFLKLCTRKRYELRPLNVANALAGLPFIGYRQSAKRCREFKADTGGLSYEIYTIIAGIVRSNARRADLVKDADAWLLKRHRKKSWGILDLRKNRYHFRRAIKAALERGTRRSLLPSEISREYWKRKSNPDAVDRAFAADESIPE